MHTLVRLQRRRLQSPRIKSTLGQLHCLRDSVNLYGFTLSEYLVHRFRLGVVSCAHDNIDSRPTESFLSEVIRSSNGLLKPCTTNYARNQFGLG